MKVHYHRERSVSISLSFILCCTMAAFCCVGFIDRVDYLAIVEAEPVTVFECAHSIKQCCVN